MILAIMISVERVSAIEHQDRRLFELKGALRKFKSDVHKRSSRYKEKLESNTKGAVEVAKNFEKKVEKVIREVIDALTNAKINTIRGGHRPTPLPLPHSLPAPGPTICPPGPSAHPLPVPRPFPTQEPTNTEGSVPKSSDDERKRREQEKAEKEEAEAKARKDKQLQEEAEAEKAKKQKEEELEEIAEEEKERLIEQERKIQVARTAASKTILSCLVSYRHNFLFEKKEITMSLYSNDVVSESLVNPLEICTPATKILKLDTKMCFGGMFSKYQEAISLLKVVTTLRITDEEQKEIDQEFKNVYEKSMTEFKSNCLTPEFKENNSVCYNIYFQKLSNLNSRMQYLRGFGAEIDRVQFYVDSILQFWDSQDWGGVVDSCTQFVTPEIIEQAQKVEDSDHN